ncbi:MATE family efflux transporter [Salinibius halmophilus]|uniref:MATE family efflux transporter n=1 Tax=Salinibius halmophilus TaxID=1853216 RepID=UPI000E66C44F|nr:MATE family efflux transporter [Salinibius halmophilus]
MSATSYTQGSIRQHIYRMTASAGIGLLAMFSAELADLFFISWLGNQTLTAAVGFAATLIFFTHSVNIGLMIATGAVVSRALGEQATNKAKRLVSHSLLFNAMVSFVITAVIWFARTPLLQLIGAEGEALQAASSYLAIVLPAFPLAAVGMAAGGIMRANGDAKGALWLSLTGALVNVLLDPLLIWWLSIEGAAIASVASRLAMFGYGVYRVAVHYRLFGALQKQLFVGDVRLFSGIGLPAVLTNLATPIGGAVVMAAMAQYGEAAVAGAAIVGRLQMLAFVGLYALSGVVGTIAGRNWGAQAFDRVERTMSESLRFIVLYCLLACALLAALTPIVIHGFNASGEAVVLIQLFTFGLSLHYVFQGMSFVSNAMFNNLGKPRWATYFNVAKATVFTAPFAWLGAWVLDAPGVLVGQAVGAVLVGLWGWLACKRYIAKLAS